MKCAAAHWLKLACPDFLAHSYFAETLACVVIRACARLVFKAEQYRTVGLCQAVRTYSALGVHFQCFAVTSSPVLIPLPSCLQMQEILQGGHLREAVLAPGARALSMSLDNGKLFCKVIVPICTLVRTLRANPLLLAVAKTYYCWVLSFLPIW